MDTSGSRDFRHTTRCSRRTWRIYRGSRLDCLVHQPCPIQLSYLGYPAPTYLECINGWIGDRELFSTLSPDEREAHPLCFINGGYMVFDPGVGIPKTNRDHSGTFRFGCFNHARKLTDTAIFSFSATC